MLGTVKCWRRKGPKNNNNNNKTEDRDSKKFGGGWKDRDNKMLEGKRTVKCSIGYGK